MWSIVKHWIDPVTRSKIHLIKGNPTSSLLAAIDTEQLPKEYGGNCNSCLNSPQCAKRFSIQEFAELLPLKSSDVELRKQMKKETIKAGKKFAFNFEVEAAGEAVEWVWQQEGAIKDDIDWSVVFTPHGAASAQPASSASAAPASSAAGAAAAGATVAGEIQVCAKCRIENTGAFMPQGSWIAPAKGTITFTW